MTEVYLVDYGQEYEIYDCENGLLMADGLDEDGVQEYIQYEGEPWAVVVRTEIAQ